MSISDLIQPRHLARRAIVYVRQSTPSQVANNHESREMQYALVRRAGELGWHANDIEVVDTDLGISGKTTAGRSGFQELVADIALGDIGILIAMEAQRLARNCTHWYQLLDLCGRADCLIADRDGVYDASSVNGRLLLGLKGQISELELHILHGRLTEGLLNKAKRGELAINLPTGFTRSSEGDVSKHPDQAVQSRLSLIFSTYLEKKSLAKVREYFLQQTLTIPRRDQLGDIHWRRPTVASIVSILKNPTYAGAFVYGRSRSVSDINTGRNRKKQLPIQEWKICIRDKYPAYISWETFEKIDQMLRDNYNEYQHNQRRGSPREGKALLQSTLR